MRDYKGRTRGSMRIEPSRLREFGVGLAVGLAVALVIFVADHRRVQSAAEVAEPKPRHQTANAASPGGADKAGAAELGAGDTAATGAAGRYDFYQMLPKFEVVVPEREHGARVAAAAPVEQPGTYFLQVGSYRDAAVAERIRAQLEKLTIEATVQRVAVDNDVWHRVRIGPIRELSQLNRLRQRLQAADLDSLVIRVDD
jgi:cell division protein FtsN